MLKLLPQSHPLHKLWFKFDKRAELDLSMKKYFYVHRYNHMGELCCYNAGVALTKILPKLFALFHQS